MAVLPCSMYKLLAVPLRVACTDGCVLREAGIQGAERSAICSHLSGRVAKLCVKLHTWWIGVRSCAYKEVAFECEGVGIFCGVLYLLVCACVRTFMLDGRSVALLRQIWIISRYCIFRRGSSKVAGTWRFLGVVCASCILAVVRL